MLSGKTNYDLWAKSDQWLVLEIGDKGPIEPQLAIN